MVFCVHCYMLDKSIEYLLQLLIAIIKFHTTDIQYITCTISHHTVHTVTCKHNTYQKYNQCNHRNDEMLL